MPHRISISFSLIVATAAGCATTAVDLSPLASATSVEVTDTALPGIGVKRYGPFVIEDEARIRAMVALLQQHSAEWRVDWLKRGEARYGFNFFGQQGYIGNVSLSLKRNTVYIALGGGDVLFRELDEGEIEQLVETIRPDDAVWDGERLADFQSETPFGRFIAALNTFADGCTATDDLILDKRGVRVTRLDVGTAASLANEATLSLKEGESFDIELDELNRTERASLNAVVNRMLERCQGGWDRQIPDR